jgi:ribonuclease R
MSGLVPLSLIEDDFYVFDEARRNLVGRRTRKMIRLGDRITVQVARVDTAKKQVDFCLAVEERKSSAAPPPFSKPLANRPQSSRPESKRPPQTRRENSRRQDARQPKSHQTDSRPAKSNQKSNPQHARPQFGMGNKFLLKTSVRTFGKRRG